MQPPKCPIEWGWGGKAGGQNFELFYLPQTAVKKKKVKQNWMEKIRSNKLN